MGDNSASIPFLDLHAAYDEIRSEIDAAMRRVMDSGYYIGGPEVDAFEHAFASYCGAKHCIGVANGLEALRLILEAAGIGPGDEVIVPSNTFVATWLAVTQVGATPVPVEPDPFTYNLDPSLITQAVTERTRAVMPVHLYGQPADVTRLRAITDPLGLLVIEDAAQAHGARLGGQRAGSLGHAAGFSFYPGKNLGAFGDGGAVTTDDDELADKLRVLRNYGSKVKYYNEVVGYNSRLDPLQAAALGAKLVHLDEWNARRSDIAAVYLDELKDIDALQLPGVLDGAESAWHLFVIRHAQRDELARKLGEKGVQTLIHYPIPPHLQPAYEFAGIGEGSLPLSEQMHREVLSLPISPHHSMDDVHRVIEVLRSVL